jgi:hypothetical protein
MSEHERGDTRLARSLQMLAETEAASETPPRVEAAIMAQWDAAQSSGRLRRTGRVQTARRVAVTTAAGITVVGALVWPRGTNESVNVPVTDRYTTVAVVGGPLLADEPIRVVRMRVARSVLGELGVPSPAPQSSPSVETVDIDVLVGEDGVARGVRVPVEAGL